VLGFIPGWVAAKILDGLGLLRVPREVELMGLDFRTLHEEEAARQEVRDAEKALV
jgi:Amt family ammonium transporter